MKISWRHKMTLNSKLHSSKFGPTFILKGKVQVCMKISTGNISRMTLIINYLYQENGLLVQGTSLNFCGNSQSVLRLCTWINLKWNLVLLNVDHWVAVEGWASSAHPDISVSRLGNHRLLHSSVCKLWIFFGGRRKCKSSWRNNSVRRSGYKFTFQPYTCW